MLFSMCIQTSVLKKEKDKHENITHGVEQYKELFVLLVVKPHKIKARRVFAM